jgi:hypothetical protein
MFRTTSMMIWAISFIALAPFALADAGGNWIVHENPSPGEGYSEQSTIQMTAEYVDIVLHQEYVQVSAVFEFENTGPECSVGMVFPLDGALKPAEGWDALQEKYPGVDWKHGGREINGVWYDENVYIKPEEAETDFQVTVDDSAPLDYSLIELLPAETSTITGYAEWYLNFDAGQKRVVSCYYTSDYGGWGEMREHDFRYILDTGSSWKGPIGYGKMTVQPGQDFADQWRKRFLLYENSGLPPAKDLGDQIVWEFENLEPGNGGGIYICIFPDFTVEHAYPGSSLEEGPGCLGYISEPNGINFRTESDSNSLKIPGKETLADGVPIAVLERNGDWYYVRTNGGYYGWARWRYVDPDSGEEYRYIHLVMTNE